MSETRNKRFNVIDFVIIVLIVGCVVGLAARYNFVNSIMLDSDKDEVVISFVVKDISPMLSDALDDGDEFFVESKNSIGVLTSHSAAEAQIIRANDNGNPVVDYDKTKRDVVGNFKGYGVMTDDGFMLNGTQFLAPGKTLTVQSLDVQMEITITDINIVEK